LKKLAKSPMIMSIRFGAGIVIGLCAALGGGGLAPHVGGTAMAAAGAEAEAEAEAEAANMVLVLGLSDEPLSAGLVDALRIQLAGVGTVEVGPDLPRLATAPRVRRARALGHERGAKLVIWVERGPGKDGGLDDVLYVVPIAAEARRVEVFRLPRSDEGDRERALALKVGGVLTRALAGQAQELESEAIDVPIEPGPDPEPDPEGDPEAGPGGSGDRTRAAGRAEPPVAGDGWTVGLGVGLARGATARSSGVVMLSGGRRLGGLGRAWPRLELCATLSLSPGATVVGAAGTVATDEAGLAFGLGPTTGPGVVELGAWALVGVSAVVATGTTPRGARGLETLWLPSLGLELGGRVWLTDRLGLSVGLGAELVFVSHDLAVNETVVASTGHGRGRGAVSLVVLLP
jgi:hypothetical protein